MKYLKIFTVLTAFFLTSCGLGQYNTSNPENIPDRNEGNEYVYGDGVGKPARQLANPDESDQESLKRTIKIKDILYPKEDPKVIVNQTPPDSIETEETDTKKNEETETEEATEKKEKPNSAKH